MLPAEAALNTPQEDEQKPLAMAQSMPIMLRARDAEYPMIFGGEAKLLMQRPDGMLVEVDSRKLIQEVVDRVLGVEYEWAKEKLHTEQGGVDFFAMVNKVNRKFPVGDEVYDKAESLDKVLRQDEIQRKKEESEPTMQMNNYNDGAIRPNGGNTCVGGMQHNH